MQRARIGVAFALTLSMAACGGGGGSGSAYGDCEDSIRKYALLNGVTLDGDKVEADENGNYLVFFAGYSGGEAKTASFRWGADYEGCHIEGFDPAAEGSAPINPSNNNPSANKAPVADAGRSLQANLGGLITLDGSASSDPDGDELFYSWKVVQQPDNGKPLFGKTDTMAPEMVWTRPGEYVVELIVTDDIDDSQPSQVSVTVLDVSFPPPRPPVDVESELLFSRIDTYIKSKLAAPDTFKVDGEVRISHFLSIGKPKEGAISFYFTVDDNTGTSDRLRVICPILWFDLPGIWVNDLNKAKEYCFYYDA